NGNKALSTVSELTGVRSIVNAHQAVPPPGPPGGLESSFDNPERVMHIRFFRHLSLYAEAVTLALLDENTLGLSKGKETARGTTPPLR
ncbi:MAG: hypothetical protein Q8O76_10125, partial [Chloroflexota bacterium]|nr:hypothetical protein [Chloroflexota bacterium]